MSDLSNESVLPALLRMAVMGGYNGPGTELIEVHAGLDPEPMMAHSKFWVTIRVGNQERYWHNKRVHVPGKAVGFSYLLDYRVVRELKSKEELLEFLVGVVRRKTPVQIAPRLFENDPRIGIQREVPGPWSTRSPLIEDFPLFDPPVSDKDPDFGKFSLRPGFSSCLLCQKKFSPGTQVVWGGGALRWVHWLCPR